MALHSKGLIIGLSFPERAHFYFILIYIIIFFCGAGVGGGGGGEEGGRGLLSEFYGMLFSMRSYSSF